MSSQNGNPYIKPRYKKFKKKNGKPKKIWVPNQKSLEPEEKTSNEIIKMCYEKFTKRINLKKKSVHLSPFWLKDFIKALSSFSRSSKTRVVQKISEENIVWSNPFDEKMIFSKDQCFSKVYLQLSSNFGFSKYLVKCQEDMREKKSFNIYSMLFK